MSGLERAVMDREMLRTPELRAIAVRYLDLVQEALTLDAMMTSGEVCERWLRDMDHLHQVMRICFLPLWPLEGSLLPPAVQVWALTVDDAVRRWQYLQRLWLAEECGLALLPTVPNITTIDAAWQEITGEGLWCWKRCVRFSIARRTATESVCARMAAPPPPISASVRF